MGRGAVRYAISIGTELQRSHAQNQCIELCVENHDNSWQCAVASRHRKKIRISIACKGRRCASLNGAGRTHHGSKTSSTDEFVRQVNPRLVIFTVGYRNRFGHPREEVMERYRAFGSTLLRSDNDGAVLLRFADNTFVEETSRVLRRRYWQDIPNI